MRNALLVTAILSATVLHAEVFTHLTGEGGVVDYDHTKDEGNGWYSEPSSDYRFKIGFKQAERKSPHPILVATLESTEAEHFQGKAAIKLQIVANEETKSLKAAYKVDIASVKPGDAFSPSLTAAKDWYHGFAMKIDAAHYQLPQESSDALTFEQWWQGSPFHPPVSLAIVNEADARAKGWADANSDGNFTLVLRDDEHNAWESGPGKPRYYNLGPVKTGRWMSWIVSVRPSPSGKGAVTVTLDGVERIKLANIRVGYDPSHYSTKPRPGTSMAYVSCCVYRLNGLNAQCFYFDEIRFADALADVSAP